MATLLEKLKLNELSLVDKGANQHARVSIFKRHDPLVETINKYYGELVASQPERIKDFKELLNLRDKENRLWKAREELWPVMDAFRETVNNIVVDVNLSVEAKMAQIESNVNSFVAAVRDKIPDVEEELTKFFKDAGLSGINPTDNTEKTPVSEENVTKMAELEASVAELTKKLAEAEAVAKMTDAEKEYVSALSDKEKIAWTNLDADERAKRLRSFKKNDETVEVAGQTISKSAVGEGAFAIFKAQAEQITKAEERIAKAEQAAEFADLRKRADDEFGNVVGSTDERANLLKALKDVGGEIEAYGLKVLKSANEAAVFTNIGKSKTEAVDLAKSLETKIAEIQKRDNVSRTVAMEKVAVEAPELIENKE